MADPPIRVVDAALAVLHGRLQTIPAATVKREPDKPIDLTVAGAVILLDGDGAVEEESMSPRTYHWRHAAEIEIRAVGVSRHTVTAGLLAAVAARLAERTLDGTVDWAEVEPLPAVDEDPAEGRATERQAILTVALYFATTDALGFTRA